MKILIADDEEYVRIELHALLVELVPRAIIEEVENGSKLEEFLNKNQYQIVFVDIKMPGPSGLEVLERVNVKNTLFVILSGYSEFEYAKKAVSLGVSEYMLKPITKKDLAEVLKKVMPSLQVYEDDENVNNKLIQDTEKLIYRRYKEQIGVSQLATELNVSPNYLSSQFKKNKNQTLTSYITDLRLKTAKEMLLLPGASVKEISFNLGYQSSRHFARLFREKYNQSPSEFMKNS
ncbi:MAG: helix-turn-helix domain-containing protein [Spirochaetaceae bacterium]